MAWIKAYKGFNDKLQCTPEGNVFQYEVGKEYETDDAKLCESGFHACEFPLDVLEYYSPADSRYCEVELDATDEQHHNDSKRTGKKIKIGAEIGLDGVIKAGVRFILEKAESCEKRTGYLSAATNTGDWSAATNTGDWSAATNTGYLSAATNTGDWSAATNTGDWSAATVTGKESVACSLGVEGKAKGTKGCWLVLAEWNDGHRTDVKCFLVDGEEIRENTFYMLRDGKAVEAED